VCFSQKKIIDFIGFELNPDYIIIANKRLEDKEEDDKNEKIKWKRIKPRKIFS
jgi:hypothetical protein